MSSKTHGTCRSEFFGTSKVFAAIRVSEWTRDEVSRMKLNADGVCVMSGYEELLRDDNSPADCLQNCGILVKSTKLSEYIHQSDLKNM